MGTETNSNKKNKYQIIAIDYGMKKNQLRCFSDINCSVTVVPANFPAEKIIKLKPDGVFLSNGPGDPAATGRYAIPIVKKLIENKFDVQETIKKYLELILNNE